LIEEKAEIEIFKHTEKKYPVARNLRDDAMLTFLLANLDDAASVSKIFCSIY